MPRGRPSSLHPRLPDLGYPSLRSVFSGTSKQCVSTCSPWDHQRGLHPSPWVRCCRQTAGKQPDAIAGAAGQHRVLHGSSEAESWRWDRRSHGDIRNTHTPPQTHRGGSLWALKHSSDSLRVCGVNLLRCQQDANSMERVSAPEERSVMGSRQPMPGDCNQA